MSLTDIFTPTYCIDTIKSKQSILDTIKQRVENAKNKSSLFSFERINYKRFIINNDIVIINLFPGLFTPFSANGTIKISFNENENSTRISAQIKPYGDLLEIICYGLIFMFFVFSSFLLWLVPGKDKYIFIVFIWFIVGGTIFGGISFYKYKLKSYFIDVLNNLEIKGELKKDK